ncbi:MAG TPA: LOG family protein, partial [Pyrinomonadaceae bacterium]|nr:LOG family protein [Pyrinomonadaceae bacterium]
MADDKYKKQIPGGTHDERLLETPRPDEFLHTDTWRVFRIMGEFVQGFEDLAHITNGVAIFGSARTSPDDPVYQAARETAGLLSRAGFAVITGGGPGIMEAANRGAQDAGAKSIGLNISLEHEQYPNPYVSPDLCFDFHYFAMRKLHFLLRA